MVARRTFATTLFGAVATLLLAAAPWGIDISGPSSEAAAAPGGSGQGNNGNSGGNSGKGNSGKDNSDKGKSSKDNSGSGADTSGGKGRGGGKESGGNPDPVKSGTVRQGSKPGDGFGQRANEHINPVTGTRVEINGSNVEAVHLDGIREEITDGRYRMNDAQGRMIIERTATESDRARFRAMIR